jgi:uncharacterized protein (TIGR02145 family)
MKNCRRISLAILLIFIITSCKKSDDKLIKDGDGNVYNSISIGTQVWMKENLKTTKYSNGDAIETTIPSALQIFSEVTPKYQWAYNGDEDNVTTYGRLYTWYAVNDDRNICPTGWHVPSDTEWHTLILIIDPDAELYLIESSIAGGNLKETGTAHWASPNYGATNETGFTALPGGFRDVNGSFGSLGQSGFWWSSTEISSSVAADRYITCLNTAVYWTYIPYDDNSKKYGYSVRCIKDN